MEESVYRSSQDGENPDTSAQTIDKGRKDADQSTMEFIITTDENKSTEHDLPLIMDSEVMDFDCSDPSSKENFPYIPKDRPVEKPSVP